MNLVIETLNVWADHALRFAWSMLWQSSLLIGLLFALDLLMRRKLRPAVRYALWLVVLVKLLVPPSLAFPTGPGWWLRTAKAAPSQTRSTSVVVSYGPTDTPVLAMHAMPVFAAPPRPRLTQGAWALLGTVTVSLGLLAWMLARWHQVARNARRAAEAPARLRELLPEPRRPVRLRLTDQPQSPAVCGLFRPVILLPRTLAEQLSPAQLRAVLLHELLHLRRGDVWVNCAQALLQIVYWWHPLLWFANARIRRVREEAVDDAVMVALNDDAEAYAPTLLEVAKLALHRPLASLGLVGILESRSSLRQRIERLMDFRPPRNAGLTLGSALTVLGFAALAVPMGEAPATNGVPQVPEAQVVSEAKFAQANPIRRELLPAPNPSSHTNLVQTSPARQAMLAKLDRIRLDSVSFDGLPLSEVVRFLADEARKRDPDKLGVNFLIRSPERVLSEATPDFITGRAQPATPAGQTDPSSIVINLKTPLTNIRLADVLDGIVMTASQPIKYSIEDNAIVFSAKTGQAYLPLYVRTFKVDPNTILESLHITKQTEGTNGPTLIAYEGPGAFKLITKHPEGTDGPGATVVAALRDYFESLGVELDPVRNPGKALFYKDRQGMFIARATMQDLDIIEAAIQVLNSVPPQINIKCKFMEVPQVDTKALGFDWYLGNVVMTNGAIGGQVGTAPSFIGPATAANPSGAYPGNPSPIPSTLTGILTDPQYRAVVKALQQRSGAEIIAQPEVTTLSGRQAQMKTVNIQTVVTGVNYMALTLPGITTTNDDQGPLYVTKPMEFGPILDVIPCVLADGYTIALTVIPTVTEFLGYEENPTNRVAVYVNGKKTWVTPPLPRFHQSQMATSVNVWDGQTVVLGGLESATVGTLKDKVPLLGDLPLLGKLFRSESKTTKKKKLLVFITPTLIDLAGNRLHTEEEMLFARDRVPVQPPH
jgi:type II secretory pathway component GspD/PulD (secretin)/beta-lactamase regulating signal transducer with metallopeptidase domain